MKSTKQSGLFAYKDYRAALRQRADEWKQAVPGATFQALAKTCRIQKAYLSRVFQEEAELSQDQVFLACEHLGIAGLERDFIVTLHMFCRSEVPMRRRHLAEQLTRQREQARETLGNVNIQPVVGEELEGLTPLFLDPDLQLAHLYLMIDRYRNEPKTLSEVLGVAPGQVEQLLETLRRLGLISVTPDGLLVIREAMHLPAGSPLFRPYRTLLRQRALAHQARLPDKVGYSLSLLFTATKDIEARLRQRFLELLKEFEPEVRAAPSESVFFLGIDLFPWA